MVEKGTGVEQAVIYSLSSNLRSDLSTRLTVELFQKQFFFVGGRGGEWGVGGKGGGRGAERPRKAQGDFLEKPAQNEVKRSTAKRMEM